ncbi:MAG: Dna binding response regulator PrrA (RegA), partial [uncultured Sphingomonas sp.]
GAGRAQAPGYRRGRRHLRADAVPLVRTARLPGAGRRQCGGTRPPADKRSPRLCGSRPQARDRLRPALRAGPARSQSGDADRGADRLRQHRHCGGSDQAGRVALPAQAVQHRRHRSGVRPGRGRRGRPDHQPADLHQDAGMGADQRNPGGHRVQHLGNGAAPGDAPTHPRPEAGETAGPL